MNTEESLREQERECLAKFRARAAKLAAQYPGSDRKALFARACEQMPRTMQTYLFATSRLHMLGVPSLPLE
jgi:hypothetical protein